MGKCVVLGACVRVRLGLCLCRWVCASCSMYLCVAQCLCHALSLCLRALLVCHCACQFLKPKKHIIFESIDLFNSTNNKEPECAQFRHICTYIYELNGSTPPLPPPPSYIQRNTQSKRTATDFGCLCMRVYTKWHRISIAATTFEFIGINIFQATATAGLDRHMFRRLNAFSFAAAPPKNERRAVLKAFMRCIMCIVDSDACFGCWPITQWMRSISVSAHG